VATPFVIFPLSRLCEINHVAHCNTLQHIATHCNTLQHTATHCNTLQHTATHCYIASRVCVFWCACSLVRVLYGARAHCLSRSCTRALSNTCTLPLEHMHTWRTVHTGEPQTRMWQYPAAPSAERNSRTKNQNKHPYADALRAMPRGGRELQEGCGEKGYGRWQKRGVGREGRNVGRVVEGGERWRWNWKWSGVTKIRR